MATRAEFIATMVSEITGTYSHALPVKSPLKELAGLCYDAIKFKGEATAAEVAALEDTKNGDTYSIITSGGALNTGADEITTAVGDTVTYDEENGLWQFLTNKATADLCYDAVKFKGEATATEVAALVGPKNGDTYRIVTSGGDLNTGEEDKITTAVGDTVTYDEENGLWQFLTIKYTTD